VTLFFAHFTGLLMTESDKPSLTLPDTVVVFADTVASLPPSMLVLTLQLSTHRSSAVSHQMLPLACMRTIAPRCNRNGPEKAGSKEREKKHCVGVQKAG
jgi:hypothetical protein